MNNLQLLTTREFNGITLNCYVEHNGSDDFWATREQIGALLGYAEPIDAIKKIHKRNKERMDMFSTVVKLSTPKRGGQFDPSFGNVQDVTVYNFKGLLEICRYSQQPNAHKVIDVLWDVADEIRRKGMYLTDSSLDTLKRDPELFDRLLKQYAHEREKSKHLQDTIDAERAFTNLGHVVMAIPEAISVKDAADLLAQKSIPVGQNRLYRKCRDEHLLCRRKGRQYNKPTKHAIEQGLFNSQVNGGFSTVALVTPKGLAFLYNLLLKENLPIVALLEQPDEQDGNGKIAFHGTNRKP